MLFTGGRPNVRLLGGADAGPAYAHRGRRSSASSGPTRDRRGSMTLEDVRRVVASPMQFTLTQYVPAHFPYLAMMECLVLRRRRRPTRVDPYPRPRSVRRAPYAPASSASSRVLFLSARMHRPTSTSPQPALPPASSRFNQ
jgi:hypothetical protein